MKMRNKKLTELSEPLGFDYNLVSVELDTSPNRLRYISALDLDDAISKDSFDTFYNRLRKEGVVIVNFDNNADMYEIEDESLVVVLFEDDSSRYVIFDIQDARKIERLIFEVQDEV